MILDVLVKIELISQRSGIYGGLKRLYKLAAYFKEAGHEAVVNIDDGSTNTWFDHHIPENVDIEPDIRIMPETWQKPHPTAKNILYVQAQFDPPKDRYDGIVTTTDFLAEKIAEDDFAPDWIIPYGFDSTIFKEAEQKPKKWRWDRVAYMPRKNKQEIELIKLLTPKCHKDGLLFIPIDGSSEKEVVEKLQKADIFLTLSREEGFGMPPFEASLCGCLIVGYHGKGGKKWLTSETAVICDFPQEIAGELLRAAEGHYEAERIALQDLIKQDLTLEKEATAWLNIINDVNPQTIQITDT